MRISSNLFFQTGVNAINAQQSDLMHLYQQVASGQKMVSPADDPLAAAQAINLSQAQSLNQRFSANRDVAKSNLGTEDNALSSVTTLLQDIKTRLIEAGNGTMSDADRATLSSVLQGSKTALLNLANSTDGNGQYLFSGYAGSQPAFVADSSGKVTYNGDTNQRLIQADQTRQIAGSDVGTDIFMHATAGSGSYVTAAAAGNTGTALISQPTVTNLQGSYVGKAFDVQFAMSADPVPVLQYTVNVLDASGGTVVATSTPVNYVTGTTSLDLGGGVQVSFTGTPQAGDAFSVEPANARYVASSSLQAGSTLAVGATSVSDSTATYFGRPFSIAFDDATNFTVTYYSDSSLTTPVGTTTGVYAAPGTISIPGSGLNIGMSGVPVAGDKVTVQPSQPTNLNIFDTLDGIISSLSTPLTGSDSGQAAFLNNLAGAIQRIDLNFNQVLSIRSSVGTRLNELDAIDSNGTLRNLGYTTQLSKLEDVDYYTATAQLQLRQSALQAAAAAFKQIQGTSLFNMGSN